MSISNEKILVTFHSRKLLHYPSFNQSSESIAPHPGRYHLLEPSSGENSFDAKIAMVLSATMRLDLLARVEFDNQVCNEMLKRCIFPGSFKKWKQFNSWGNSQSRDQETGSEDIPSSELLSGPEIPGVDSECVICLTEFSPGEKIRILPKCNHGFHVKCIDKWLNFHSSCPTCRHCLIETCQKIVGCTVALQPSINTPLPGQSQEIIINIAPLEPESMVRNFNR